VVSGGNIDAAVLAQLLSDVRPRPPRKPRRRAVEGEPSLAGGRDATRAAASTTPIKTGARRIAAPALATEVHEESIW
jgi:threonine dehydratase